MARTPRSIPVDNPAPVEAEVEDPTSHLQQIQDLQARVAKLESLLVKTASYTDILSAVDNAVKSAPIAETMHNHLLTAARGMASQMNRDQTASAVQAIVNENKDDVCQRFAMYLSQSITLRGELVRAIGTTAFQTIDVQQALKEYFATLFEGSYATQNIFDQALRNSESRIAGRLANSSSLHTVLTTTYQNWVQQQSFRLVPR